MSDHAKQLSADELRRRAELQRDSVRQTAEALQDRIRAKSEPVQHALSEVRTRARRADGFIRSHHWAFVGASLLLGATLGVRGGRRRRRRREERMLPAIHERHDDDGGEHVRRKSAVGAFAGMMLARAGSALAREAAGVALARYEQWRHDQAMEQAMREGAFMGTDPTAVEDDADSPYPEYVRYPGQG